ncbi:cholesterol transport system auxiliary component [Tistlia consotensis]|uniref:Cholesterol transport system auxiliary component n=1 Tax=Tistlia consotensis USBA 355 TaxID=560819 RepID=A0A1Y6C1H8_9PROT|nr:ABC-type transport auxiliary lipoprotein family protein [Tistlia consotensis]SMF39257.1 cholesterol transport system auxiliary component [Tistlia consotensis USBA 355]SNR36482.1 cholesterol transport system auxiliary component [Tistlia consotensis]
MRHNRPNASGLASRRALLLGAGSLLALAGCNSILTDRPPPQLFRLSPKSTYPADLPTVPWQLVLEMPVADAGVNTQRIALVRSANQIEYYARANWTDRAPAMFQTMLIESFENSRRIVSVGRESLGLRADFVLKSELREFQAVYDGAGPPSVRVGLALKLVAMPRREIVAATDVERIAPAAADTLEDVVDAFDTASGHVLKEIVVWVLTAGEKHWLQDHPEGGKAKS